MNENLGQHKLVFIRGRGIMIHVEDQTPSQFRVGQAVTVNGKPYNVRGIEGCRFFSYPPKEKNGVDLFLKELDHEGA